MVNVALTALSWCDNLLAFVRMTWSTGIISDTGLVDKTRKSIGIFRGQIFASDICFASVKVVTYPKVRSTVCMVQLQTLRHPMKQMTMGK